MLAIMFSPTVPMSISGPEDTILGTGPPRQNLISLDGIGPKIKHIL